MLVGELVGRGPVARASLSTALTTHEAKTLLDPRPGEETENKKGRESWVLCSKCAETFREQKYFSTDIAAATAAIVS